MGICGTFSVSSCPDVLSDDGFNCNQTTLRALKQTKIIYRPCILSPGRYFSLDLCHFKFCDRVFTQTMQFYDDILVSLVPDKYVLENGVLFSG